jgi:hypothetical protein
MITTVDLSESSMPATDCEGQIRACHFREPAVGCIGGDFQKLFDTPAQSRAEA